MTGEEFRDWRKRLRLRQTDAAKALGISATRVGDYEAGKTRHKASRPAPIPRAIALACAAIEHGLDPE